MICVFLLKDFLSYHIIDPIIVKLPTRKQIKATHKGIVKITDKLFLQDVLCIPNFTYNLISISKLTSNCNL